MTFRKNQRVKIIGLPDNTVYARILKARYRRGEIVGYVVKFEDTTYGETEAYPLNQIKEA